MKNIFKLFSSKEEAASPQQANQLAGENNDLYYNLFKNTTVGLYQTTPDGKILSANPAIIKMLKFDSLEDLLHRDLSKGSYVDDNKREQFKSILEREGKITDFESEWYTKDGQIIYVKEGAYAVRDSTGRICRFDGAVENITYLKLTEQELIAAKEKAEENDRLKSAFLANISHEIRTPMNSILGFAELLKEPDLTGKTQKQYIHTIEESGERMLNLINDLIDISKIESGQMGVKLANTNINEVFNSLLIFFEIEAKKKETILSTHLPLPNDEATIITDKEKLFAILTNLIKNAIKHTNKGNIDFGYTIKNRSFEFFVQSFGSPFRE